MENNKKAIWNGAIIAEASNQDIIEIEGNVYFPPNSIKREFFTDSQLHTTCPWKGLANYYDINVDGSINAGAAWYYPEIKDGSLEKVGRDFSNYVAFWKGVEVS